ncbi:MAG: hypothetical protein WA862_00385 [Solirubrobacterales bacterium]
MSYSDGRVDGTDATRALIEELLRTAFALQDVLGSLLEEMPKESFPGEDNAAVLLEMVVGSCRPAVEAAGESECWAATALIGSIRDRVTEDLRAAAELAKRRQ